MLGYRGYRWEHQTKYRLQKVYTKRDWKSRNRIWVNCHGT